MDLSKYMHHNFLEVHVQELLYKLNACLNETKYRLVSRLVNIKGCTKWTFLILPGSENQLFSVTVPRIIFLEDWLFVHNLPWPLSLKGCIIGIFLAVTFYPNIGDVYVYLVYLYLHIWFTLQWSLNAGCSDYITDVPLSRVEKFWTIWAYLVYGLRPLLNHKCILIGNYKKREHISQGKFTLPTLRFWQVGVILTPS